MDTRNRMQFLFQVAHTPAKAAESVRQECNFTIAVGDTYLPAFVSEGKLFVQAPFGLIFEAIAQAISAQFSDMEVGISIEGRAAFSLDSAGGAVSGPPVAQ